MLKKLRNKILLMNMISTFFLVILAFSAIFAMTYNNMQRDINESLFRAFSFHRPMQQPRVYDNRERAQEKPQNERVLRDMRTFSVFVESDGTVRTNSMLGENSEHYKKVAQAALNQNLERGEFKSEDIVWRFEKREIGEGAKIIALADITAEKGFLLQLAVSFGICAAILLILIFAVSMHFANRAIAPVKDAWDKQKQFVADASHELKTPLTAINTNVDAILSQREKTVGEQEKWLKYIKSEAQRLSELTGSLLFMARVSDGQNIQMGAAPLSEIIESSVLNLEAVAFEKGVRFSYDIEENVYASHANESQLTRLCLILLDNAIKYSPEGGTVRVEFSAESGKLARLCVHNGGEHIPKEELTKIFDRFYRTDKSRASLGYGLGLSIAKKITELHKGKITVRSSREEGTEFTVTLPL